MRSRIRDDVFMRILVLEPFDRGSHAAFLSDWAAHSCHSLTRLGLAGRHWKWRMRHAAVTLAREVSGRCAAGESWDVLFCSDMLNLAEFIGLAPEAVRGLPRVAYFHENQLTYPTRHDGERDQHFAYSNFMTCLAADEVWFNSGWHRDDFLGALDGFLRRMPDHGEVDLVNAIRSRSRVMSPGVVVPDLEQSTRTGPPRIVWAARWEHDKGPELFFDACTELHRRGYEFRLIVLGESFPQLPTVFSEARTTFADHIEHWGYAPDRETYCRLLNTGHVVVSTAHHEFFGLSMLEAAALGCTPVAPRALAYPETLGESAHFHDGTARGVADAIQAAAEERRPRREVAEAIRRRYLWSRRVDEFDSRIGSVARQGGLS